jgi:hypothetical protein
LNAPQAHIIKILVLHQLQNVFNAHRENSVLIITLAFKIVQQVIIAKEAFPRLHKLQYVLQAVIARQEAKFP